MIAWFLSPCVHCAQPVAFVDPKARKRERRARKGVGGANGIVFAEKMQSALAGLESINETKEDLDSKKAAGRAFQAGARVEDEVIYGFSRKRRGERRGGGGLAGGWLGVGLRFACLR